MTLKLLGIAGPDGVGKSHLAAVLAETFGSRSVGLMCTRRVAFADQLREELYLILNFANQLHPLDSAAPHVEAWQKPTPPAIRNLLRGYGDWRRSHFPDYWIRAWQNRLRLAQHEAHDSPLLVIADDVRYRNECETVQNLGGHVVYLDDQERPAHELIGREGGHELVDVRLAADLIVPVNPFRKLWADPELVVEQLNLDQN